ncbi:flagellar protein G [Haloferax mediterranei ATCC 33500]|uniref:Fla cluster protein flaG n=1 Tax=Haloferax mediterranei (strain ATCC 33500 / DSM 1411 / JCM 8866 / NBRC 14739 / NCIMB 2177 / R-4) TaxID=523841 RepID=I3R3X8_HALMT|nr:CARDB domain-containing protein [Haloferax mediterranei]AFK18938.1 fla cluster protein flaG [Haloferax mediterranei ATCC 33500]AHZ21700.1 flagellar protein G [Haloferax mediterranei ATCC 33500]EMA03204.1 fla cluster protein flaG [Haloferax mediterranei ATCC 33500]MDX5989029.1 CARDB domain-containing protein [Haloferax mediterranei ATCC 33500]QCQ75423.1 flagellar protein G [Haloferax mediterranei ATCC 33500]
MADISVPSLILFIASIVVAAGVSGVLIDTVTGISSSLDDRGGDVSSEIRTDIEVISDPQGGVYDDANNNLSVYVKNTGLRTLPATSDGFDIIVDAQYQSSVTVTVVDGTEWRPSNVVRVDVTNLDLSSGDHRIKIVVDGDEEVFEFNVQ